ncbi:uncharacterized protein PAM68-like [Rhodamnia argentea]|uniref:Uncharacterized protein PAM68-like n=1 Tax=Rhodamnia argentea TaxID=178133 RepID=A0A8B8PF32_9MYRT|nr:uncharacterized protein PAM68-like [Rhodamnia argentea]
MKSLLFTSKPPLISTSNLQRHLSSTHSSSIPPNRRRPPPLKPWKLDAKAKGFAGPPRPPGKARPTAGRPDTSKSNYDDGEDDDQIPQAVFGRMIGRILAFVGVPMATGVALLNVFGAIKERELWDVPRWLPFLMTLLCFGASALGIAYGTLSSSWDPDKSGSVLGLDEAQRNWAEIWKEEEQT